MLVCQIVGAGLRLSCLGSSLGGNLELKERETRQKRERWNQDRILIKAGDSYGKGLIQDVTVIADLVKAVGVVTGE